MRLDLVNEFFNNLKENKFVQNFMRELSNYLEENIGKDSETFKLDNQWNDLLSEDLTLYNKKIISKYRNEMLIERANILQDYAENTKEDGEMYYIYNTSTSQNNSYNLSMCDSKKSHEVITKPIEELPKGANLGSVLRKQDEKFILDVKTTKDVEEKINKMIKEKIEEQDKYLTSKRIEGHIYEVGEKHSGRIWLYDLNNTNNGMEAIEEIEFPKDLYENARQGDKYIYKDGKYQIYI